MDMQDRMPAAGTGGGEWARARRWGRLLPLLRRGLSAIKALAAVSALWGAVACVGLVRPAATPEEMARWDAELPVDRPADPDAPPPPDPFAAAYSHPLRDADFWVWLHWKHPDIHADPRMEAWREFQRGAAAAFDSGEPRTYRKVSTGWETNPRGCLLERPLLHLHQLEECRQNLEALDTLLAGGPLPWPPVEEVAAHTSPGEDTILPRMTSVTEHALYLMAADAVGGAAARGDAVGRLIRVMRYDRRFHVEPDYLDFLHNDASPAVLGWLGLTGKTGEPPVFDLRRVTCDQARTFLESLPEPALQDPARSRRWLRMAFMRQRYDLVGRPRLLPGWLGAVMWDHVDTQVTPRLLSDVCPPLPRRAYLACGLAEGALKYAWCGRRYVASVVAAQREVDAALDDPDTALETLRRRRGWPEEEEFSLAYPHRCEFGYMRLCRRMLDLPARNDTRLLLHVFMKARAAETPVEALKAAREASGRWCGGRLAVERIAGELRLTLGESSIMMPDEPDTGSRVPHVRPVDGVAEVCRAPSRQGGGFGARVHTARAAAEGTPL